MLSKFQRGDRVEHEDSGDQGIVVDFYQNTTRVLFDDGLIESHFTKDFQLIERVYSMPRKKEVVNKRNMGALQKLTILAKTLVDSDLKTLLKAGWLNSSLELTVEGEDAIFAHYLTTHKADLAKLAKAEMKENRKGRDDDDEDEKKG